MTRRQYNQRQHAAAPIRSELRSFICNAFERSCRPSDVLGYWAGILRPCASCGASCEAGVVVVGTNAS